MASYYRAFAPKSEAVKYWDNRATLTVTLEKRVVFGTEIFAQSTISGRNETLQQNCCIYIRSVVHGRVMGLKVRSGIRTGLD